MAAKKKDMVRIICYNQVERMERKDALDKYLEGMMMCDGSERERYASIYSQLMAGYQTCSDKL